MNDKPKDPSTDFAMPSTMNAYLSRGGLLESAMIDKILNPIDYAAIAKQLETANLASANFGSTGFKFPGLLSGSFIESPEVTRVKDELSALQKKFRVVTSELEAKDKSAQDIAAELDNAKKTLEQIEKKNRLSYLLNRLDARAHPILLADDAFADRFADGEASNAYVISIDIRRSTELMLKASSPKAFAGFMSDVSSALSGILKSNFGVLDKFTGDGMLGFFPEFYSGRDAGIRAIRAAEECHKAFEGVYKKNWTAFDTVLLDVGLGIGVDFGQVQLMRVAEGLTVVGRPVVYACRLSGAPAGSTFVNESARSALARTYPSIRFDRVEHLVKHEGRISVSTTQGVEAHEVRAPDWLAPEGVSK